MTGLSLLATALLLGMYVVLAGCYGLLYAIARLQGGPTLRRAAISVYVSHGVVAMAIVVWTPLGSGWKALIVASSIAFFAIPPITWRYLQRIHETEEA